jgi:hypothetical protein
LKIVEAAIDEGTACSAGVSNYRQIVNAIFKLAVNFELAVIWIII